MFKIEFNTGVDFWSSPHQNRSEVTFLVGPSQTSHVKKYLKKHNYKAKVAFVLHSLIGCSMLILWDQIASNQKVEKNIPN